MAMEDRVAELERLRIMALRDLSVAYKRIEDYERWCGRRAPADLGPGVCEDTIPELKRQVALLTVSPVLPANRPEDQVHLVEETGSWLSMPDRLERFEEDNYWLKQENKELKNKVEKLETRLAESQVERRKSSVDQAAEKDVNAVVRVITVLQFFARGLFYVPSVVFCLVVLALTWRMDGWFHLLLYPVVWYGARFATGFLFNWWVNEKVP